MSAEVIARLTVSRRDGKRTIVEVRADATFSKFYHFFTQTGAKRSTKSPLRTASRNEYLPVVNAHRYQPGLDVIEKQLKALMVQTNPVVKTTLRIIKKREYKRLINAAPDVLGMARIHTADLSQPKRFAVRIRSQRAIPVGKWLAGLKARQAQVAQ